MTMENLRNCVSLLCIIMISLIVVLMLHATPCICYTSYVFGDSLVDAGNNDYIFTLSKADSPPYGIDFAPSGGKPTGRFTNGRTISDIIGEALGNESFPPPYLSPDSLSNAVLGGLNYASGASGILDQTGTLFIGRISLGAQISYFEQTRTYMVRAMGENGTRTFLSKALFSLTIGSNDVLNYFQPSIPFFEEIKVSPTVFQDFMISNLTVQLKRARKFVVVGVGPLGCIPFVRALRLVASGKCSVEVNTLIQGYNRKLSALLQHLNQELGPEAMFVYANSYDVVTGIIQNYRHYGFDNGEDPCCGGYFPPYVCFKGSNANMSSTLCDNRSKYSAEEEFRSRSRSRSRRMGHVVRVRFASFFAGAALTSAIGLYVLRDDYKSAHQSISLQMDGLYETLDGRISKLEKLKEVEAAKQGEATE
ncbi:unnamed protein product [Camellia sinensis]